MYIIKMSWKQLENVFSYSIVNISLNKRHRISIGEDKKNAGDGWSWWLHSNLNAPNATELYTYKWLAWSILRYLYFTTIKIRLDKFWELQTEATLWRNAITDQEQDKGLAKPRTSDCQVWSLKPECLGLIPALLLIPCVISDERIFYL